MSLSMRLLAVVGLVALLGGCVVSGPTDLVSEAEAVTPLADSFTFHPYSERDGIYVLSKDDPMPFTRAGTQYVAGDGSVTLRFARLDDASYLIGVGSNDEAAFYGTAEPQGDVMILKLVLENGITAETLGALADAPSDEVRADIVAQQGGIIITRRDTLDYVIEKLRDGTIPARPLIGWIGTNGATPPARILATQDGYAPAD